MGTFLDRLSSLCKSNNNSWHADIKPDNILEVEGKFKLADPGFAIFLKRDKEKSESEPKARIQGGTYSLGNSISL